MKFALVSTILLVLVIGLDQSTAAPFFLDRIRLPNIAEIPQIAMRAFENGRDDLVRNIDRNNQAIGRMIARTGDSIDRGSQNVMTFIDGVIPDIIPGVPIIG